VTFPEESARPPGRVELPGVAAEEPLYEAGANTYAPDR
jgi:hypothetical protein